jgi:hypothetical protein
MKIFRLGLYGVFAVMTCCAQEKGLYRENDTMIEGVVKVVDEENKPVQGVELEFLFATTLHQMTDENRGDSFTVQKVTNAVKRSRRRALQSSAQYPPAKRTRRA